MSTKLFTSGENGIVPFKGYFTSADATALSEENSRITLYGQGSASALTVGASDQVFVTSAMVVTAGDNSTTTLYDGADNSIAVGERIIHVLQSDTSAVVPVLPAQFIFDPPFGCQVGTYPKVKNNVAATVNVYIRGYIKRA